MTISGPASSARARVARITRIVWILRIGRVAWIVWITRIGRIAWIVWILRIGRVTWIARIARIVWIGRVAGIAGLDFTVRRNHLKLIAVAIPDHLRFEMGGARGVVCYQVPILVCQMIQPKKFCRSFGSHYPKGEVSLPIDSHLPPIGCSKLLKFVVIFHTK